MPLPQIKPMQLSRRVAPFDHPDWIFELKHDEFRVIAYVAHAFFLMSVQFQLSGDGSGIQV